MPFGAVIVAADGRVLAEAENSTVVDKDIASHAEINAIRKVCTNGAQESLAGATIYTNCPPCPMCFGAIIRYGVSRVIYGASWAALGASLPSKSVAFAASLEKMAESASPAVVVIGPCLEDEGKISLSTLAR
jgi:tRNA(adenine34) deaminase